MTKPRHKKDDAGNIIKVEDNDEEIDPGRQISDASKLRDFFRCSNIGSTLKAGFRRREAGGTGVLFLVVLVFGLIEFVTNGERLLDVVYIRNKFPYDSESSYQEFQDWYGRLC